MLKRLLPLTLLLLTACAMPLSLSSGSGGDVPDINLVVTQMAATMQATPGLPAAGGQIEGAPFQSESIQLTIPAAVAAGASETRVPARGPSDETPPWDIHAGYAQIDLTGYAVGDHLLQPRIYVFPINAFAAVNEGASRAFSDLNAILSGALPIPEHDLPFLPVFNAAQVFSAQVREVEFQNGSGLRFLTQFNQGVVPISNREAFYAFQGLTGDGQYYVAAVLPVRIGILPNTGDPGETVPPGGFAFPDWNSPDFITQFETYLTSVDAALEAAPAGDFAPSMDLLDAMIASILIP